MIPKRITVTVTAEQLEEFLLGKIQMEDITWSIDEENAHAYGEVADSVALELVKAAARGVKSTSSIKSGRDEADSDSSS